MLSFLDDYFKRASTIGCILMKLHSEACPCFESLVLIWVFVSSSSGFADDALKFACAVHSLSTTLVCTPLPRWASFFAAPKKEGKKRAFFKRNFLVDGLWPGFAVLFGVDDFESRVMEALRWGVF